MLEGRISVILKEVIDNFINEELSINNKLEQAVEIASKEILAKYRNNDVIDEKKLSIICDYDGVTYSIPMITLVCDVNVEDLRKIHCIINIYKVQDEETIDKVYSELECGGKFNEYNGNIEITIYSVNDGINLQWLRHLMYHECEHSFQFEMSGKVLEPTNAYVKAKNIIQGKDVLHNSEMFNDVAWLVYYYNKLEMDANINSLYGEMMTDELIEYDDTNFNRDNLDIRTIFNKVIPNIDKEEVQDAIRYFEFTPSRFVKYVIKQMQYLNNKVKRVLWLARNRRQSIRENIRKVPNTLKHKPIGKIMK